MNTLKQIDSISLLTINIMFQISKLMSMGKGLKPNRIYKVVLLLKNASGLIMILSTAKMKKVKME